MKHLLIAGAVSVVLGATLVAQSSAPPLNVPPAQAKNAVVNVLNYGLGNPGLGSAASAFKALSPAARAQAAAAAVAWTKAYVASPEFKTQYAAIRQQHKPTPPTYTDTPEQEVAKQHQQSAGSPDDMKKMLDALPPDQRKQVEETLKQVQAQMAALDTPENRKMQVDTVKAERADRQKNYEAAMVKWGTDYPDSPTPLISKRLKEFLERTANVDFDAKLTGTGHSQQFVNPDYQHKDDDWKMAFRAGRDATAAARSAVQAWLKELGAA
jgi:uncharacterized membrane protein YdfJ with MMPL/SSD domain